MRDPRALRRRSPESAGGRVRSGGVAGGDPPRHGV